MSSAHRKKPDIFQNRHSVIVNMISGAEESLNILGDSKSASIILSEQIRNVLQDAKKRKLKIRYITEITKKNLNACKEIKKITEVRHLDKITGNYILTDKEYFGLPQVGNSLSSRNHNENLQ